jgi:hypothetical protein
MKKLFLILVLGVLISACYPAGSDVTHAEAVDYVWGYEELRSGAVRVWLRYDNIAGYCTSDSSLASKAKELNGRLVTITFETVHRGDNEAGRLWKETGCNRLRTGSESSTPIFRMTDIELYRGPVE